MLTHVHDRIDLIKITYKLINCSEFINLCYVRKSRNIFNDEIEQISYEINNFCNLALN